MSLLPIGPSISVGTFLWIVCLIHLAFIQFILSCRFIHSCRFILSCRFIRSCLIGFILSCLSIHSLLSNSIQSLLSLFSLCQIFYLFSSHLIIPLFHLSSLSPPSILIQLLIKLTLEVGIFHPLRIYGFVDFKVYPIAKRTCWVPS